MEVVPVGTHFGSMSGRKRAIRDVTGKDAEQNKDTKKKTPPWYVNLPGWDASVGYGVTAFVSGGAALSIPIFMPELLVFKIERMITVAGIVSAALGVYLLSAKFIHYQYTISHATFKDVTDEIVNSEFAKSVDKLRQDIGGDKNQPEDITGITTVGKLIGKGFKKLFS